MNSKVVVYPKLPALHHLIIRFRGSGLANCLFVYARALILADKHSLNIINPSWVQFNLGPYLRNEKDKRHYNGLFKPFGISDVKKNWLLLTQKSFPENSDPQTIKKGIIRVTGLGNYFTDLHHHNELIKNHLLSIINAAALKNYQEINYEFVGIHIRLGDYNPESRVSLNWYLEKMSFIQEKCNAHIKFLVFSDGKPEELEEILKFKNTSMAFFGSAIADILVLSKAKLIIASDSTFSAWAAYLNQSPIVFNKRHFDPVLNDSKFEWVQDQQDSKLIDEGIQAVFG